MLTSFPLWLVVTKYPVTSKTTSPEKEAFPTFDLGLIFNNLTGSTAFGETDVLGYDLKKGALRLLDLLGYGDLSHFKDITSVNIETLKVSPFRLLAYQKVCSDFYRVGNYESSRIISYNIDSPLYPTTSFLNFVKAYLQLRYRPWKKDRYTISSTSFQGNDYMSQTITSPGFPSVDWTNNLKPYSDNGSFTGNLGGLSLSTLSGSNIGFSVANLRSAFALDKLYRLSAAAGDGDYKSQIKARYGIDPYAPQYKSEFIGSASAPVQINPITTTADTLDSAGDNGTPAGRVYGNGIAQSSGDVFE